MTWVVDIGNSSIKWAECADGEVGKSHSFYRTAQGVAEDLDSIWGNDPSPEELICSCVAGQEFEQALEQWCHLVWGIKPVFIRSTAQANGVRNAYQQCDRLGSDRWAALVAAHQLISGPSCVISCGTAMTIDVLEADGQHMGGLIIPGRRLMTDSLSSGTKVSIEGSEGDNTTLFARNTADAINGGVLYSIVATLDRVYHDVDQALGASVHRVITGGDADDILPLLSGKIAHYPDLVLQGLAILGATREEEPS